MQIEAGKFYRTRDGRKVGPMERAGSQFHGSGAWVLSGLKRGQKNPQRYMKDGCVSMCDPGEEPDTLIAEWVDEPTGKTLKELDPNPGDVVQSTENGQSYEILRKSEPEWFEKNGDYLCTGPIWTIVSRAEPDDLRETITKLRDIGMKQPEGMFEPTETKPQAWWEMTNEAKGALLLDKLEGAVIEWRDPSGAWLETEFECPQDGEVYRKQPTPVRETVTLHYGDDPTEATKDVYPSDTHTITFTTIDGKPDCASIKMEELTDE